MSRTRTLALGSLLSLVFVTPLFEGCESNDTSTTQVDAGTGTFEAGGGGTDADVVPSTCAAATGAGTKHDQSPTADETWTAATSPHVVGASLSIPAGRTITVEPCAVVQIKGAVGMVVEGKLLAEGAADRPIRVERGDASTAWTSIEARKGSELRFAHVTLDGGGNPNGGQPTQLGALDIRGDQDAATQPILFVDHVTVKGSQSLGVLVREGGGFAPGSKELSISGGASFPISIWARAAGTLPSGTYTGNATDEIILPALGGPDDVKEDTTFAARGVPYRIGGPTGGKVLTVGGTGSIPLLTIEPGVTLRFEKGARIDVDSASGVATGALRAEGTADKPIVLTSAAATPAAGDWVGVVIEGTPDARDEIAHAKISFAGGASQISSFDCPSPMNSGFANEGAILVVGGQPATAFVTNTVIDSSAGDGIVRGWTGDVVDLLATNTFTNVTRCNQTFPKPNVGACPVPAPCPK
ncbi:MAG: hypothetical protein JWP87_5290 [Labilithrix sp.]|nr:hypothetical protein [Labilithrix sp.]